MKQQKLIFVYAADSGKLNALFDSAHKLISPSTYKCTLCKLTYGLIRQRGEWAAFIKTFEHPLEFLHRDEWAAHYPSHAAVGLPAVFRVANGSEPVTLITASEINRCRSLDELIALIRAKT